MAYNTSKGSRNLGDIVSEEDADTKIDFDSDSIALVTNNDRILKDVFPENFGKITELRSKISPLQSRCSRSPPNSCGLPVPTILWLY